jgi:hypothetical protein
MAKHDPETNPAGIPAQRIVSENGGHMVGCAPHNEVPPSLPERLRQRARHDKMSTPTPRGAGQS